MNINSLLEQLYEKAVTLSVKGDELVVHGKRQALTPSLLALVRENKKALAELICSGEYICPKQPVIEAPPNLIPSTCDAITPGMLPLVQLSATDIERIISMVPGGAINVQDIYPLTPLQEGIL